METVIPLQVKDLVAGYQDKVILNGISFDVAPGEIRAILGKSGCGKSTLLNQMLGLQASMGGTVSYFGSTFRIGSDPIPRSIRKRCGVLFQNGALLSSMTLGDNVALPLRTHRPELKSREIKELVATKLESVSLQDSIDKLPSELSGGMAKRGALARALILDPGILFCDEPTAGLDPVTGMALNELLFNIREQQGIAIIVVTHDLQTIERMADRLLFLSNGKVLFDGDKASGYQSSEPELMQFLQQK